MAGTTASSGVAHVLTRWPTCSARVNAPPVTAAAPADAPRAWRNPRRVTNDPMEATYTGFRMWTQAVAQAGTTAVDAVRQAMIGQKVMAPCGYEEEMRSNHVRHDALAMIDKVPPLAQLGYA